MFIKKTRAWWLWAAVLIGANQFALGQTDSSAGWGTLNYAVPESPAFKILGVTPSSILRPATTRDIAVSIGNYLAKSGATIATNLSVAVSPSIFNPKVSLEQYQQAHWWYNSSWSFGTKQNSNKSYAVALGFSFKIIDNADLRLNKSFTNFIYSVGPSINASDQNFFDTEAHKMASQWNLSPVLASVEVSNALNDTSNIHHATVQKDWNAYWAGADSKVARDMQKISDFRDSIRKASWNATVLQVGLAGLLNSKDSLIKNLSTPPSWGLWATLGFPVTPKGQLLLGINAQNTLDTATNNMAKNFNGAFRLYLGRSDFKGYIQGEGKFMDHEFPVYDAGIGIETTFFGGLWLDFALGVKKTGSGPWSFNPTIDFHFANGEKSKPSKK